MIKIEHTSETTNSGYDLNIQIQSDDTENQFNYKIYIKSSMALHKSGSLSITTNNIIYLDIFDETILIEILDDSRVVYTMEFTVREIEEPEIEEEEFVFDYNMIFIIIALAGLMVSIVGLVYQMTRKRKLTREQIIIS